MQINVLMCGSTRETKGGMSSVVNNYLDYSNWGPNIRLFYVPTHFESNKFFKTIFYVYKYWVIFFIVIWKKINIAHLHTSEKGSIFRKAFLALLLKKMGVKVILHHHGAEFEIFFNKVSPRKKKFIIKILEVVHSNIVLSERLKNDLLQKAPLAKVLVLYNAVKVYSKNRYSIDAKNILFLGRLGKRKGAYDFITAIKKLDSTICPDIKFFLCGDGDIDIVKEKIGQLKLSHRVGRVGWVSGEEKNTILAQTMINVLPSYNEGLPMTILETMLYGIPNISTNIASIPEVIKDGVNGFLISPGDIDSLVCKIKELIDDRKLRQKFSVNSYDLVNNSFSLEHNVGQLKECYRKMLR
jgi:glycosyltransferase involved in cell wall biosynthesis